MAKLFIAIDVPTLTATDLVRLQPAPRPGLRLVEIAQMHVTLHFVGEADPATLTDELQKLSPVSFEVHLEGVGHFRSPSGAITLWAGVRKSPELVSLHCAVADILRRQGIPTEERAYTPHVTLARCERDVPEHVMTDFLARHQLISFSAAPVVCFELYSSTSVDGVPRYERVRSFPLHHTDSDWAVHRQDDNGNRFVVRTGLRREEAERLAAEFESRSHKQLYWVERADGR